MIKQLLWRLKINTKKRLSPQQQVLHIAIILLLLNLIFLLTFSNLGLNLKVMNNPNSNDMTFSFAQEFIDNYKVHYNDYVEGEYDCSEFSKDAVMYAEDMGAYCQVIGGFKSLDFTKGGHAWNRCDIEPQNLSFVNYNSLYPIQMVIG